MLPSVVAFSRGDSFSSFPRLLFSLSFDNDAKEEIEDGLKFKVIFVRESEEGDSATPGLSGSAGESSGKIESFLGRLGTFSLPVFAFGIRSISLERKIVVLKIVFGGKN